MDAADITTLLERCAAPALARPVAAIMRQASEFEHLLVTIAGKRPIRVLADSKPESLNRNERRVFKALRAFG